MSIEMENKVIYFNNKERSKIVDTKENNVSWNKVFTSGQTDKTELTKEQIETILFSTNNDYVNREVE